MSHQHEEIYSGNIHADELKIWAQERCIPLVRWVLKQSTLNDASLYRR